jgi:hypothetical protein
VRCSGAYIQTPRRASVAGLVAPLLQMQIKGRPFEVGNTATLQVQRLLACSVPHGRPTLELRQEMEQAMRNARASMHRHIPSDNRGSVLLRRMGWSEGSGLGAQRQGRREPVPLHLGQRRQGLGS